jgi:DNA-binding MarR family transcriptional regulator
MGEQLKLSNQVCFPVYMLAKEIVSRYRPFLEELGLTYPQYLVLLVLWEEDGQTLSQIGEKLHLDSGTLTPLLKRMEQKHIIVRTRNSTDERSVNITLTPQGKDLREKALAVPKQLIDAMKVPLEELSQFKNRIDHLLSILDKRVE